MSDQEIVQALREHNQPDCEKASTAAPTLVSAIEQALPALDERSRQMAVSCLTRCNAPTAGDLLLKMTGDPSGAVSAAAAQALLEIKNLPPAEAMLTALKQRGDPLVREFLYRALGKTHGAQSLEPLRALLMQEQDTEARTSALAAAAKLGGGLERNLLLRQIEKTEPEDAMRMRDILLYVADPKMAAGMLPWLSDERSVIRIGADAQSKSARMRDVAVWTAHLLHIPLHPPPAKLDNYPPALIHAAETAIKAQGH